MVVRSQACYQFARVLELHRQALQATQHHARTPAQRLGDFLSRNFGIRLSSVPMAICPSILARGHPSSGGSPCQKPGACCRCG